MYKVAQKKRGLYMLRQLYTSVAGHQSFLLCSTTGLIRPFQENRSSDFVGSNS